MFDYQVWDQVDGAMKRRPGHIAFELLPRGMSHFYYVLRNDDMQIQAVRYPSIQYPTVYIQIRARLIWAVGYQNALAYCLAVAEAIFGKFARSSLSRVDFTVDIEGWNPTAEGLRIGLVSRARKKELRINQDTSITAAYYKGDRFTGISLGKGGDLMARIYDKTEEIAVNGTKTWFYEVWKKNGWSGQGRVMRAEFQCRRRVLNAFGFGDSVESLSKFAGMFRYLTTEWLRLCLPDPMQKRRTRWKTAPVWTLIQSANFGNGGDVTRQAQKLPERKHLMDQFRGLATTIAARHGVKKHEGLQDFIMGILINELTEDDFKKMKKKFLLYESLSLVKTKNKSSGLALREADRARK